MHRLKTETFHLKEVKDVHKKGLATLLTLVLLSAVFALGGCSTAQTKKPVPQTGNRVNATRTVPNATPTTPATPNTSKSGNTVTRPAAKPLAPMSASESRRLADRLTNLAASVKGVKSATVVLQPGNNAYAAMVGITLDRNVSGTETKRIKTEVARKLEKADKRVTRVLVTSDPNLVKRIEDIARGVIAGKPISSFTSQLSELGRRIEPTTR